MDYLCKMVLFPIVSLGLPLIIRIIRGLTFLVGGQQKIVRSKGGH